MRKIILAVALLTASALSYAQTDSLKNQLTIGLNFMSHGEYCDGGLPQSDTPIQNDGRSYFIMGRTRIDVGFKRPNLEMKATIQNKAVWGTSNNMNLGLYEGWVKMFTNGGLFAQIGRIALAYDDERIIGTNDFAMAALSHDILRAGYEGHGHKLHLGAAFNQNASMVYSGTYYNGGAQPYKNLQMAWYHYDASRIPLSGSLLIMNIGLQSGIPGSTYLQVKNVYQFLAGGYINFHPKYLTFEASYYKQKGYDVDPQYMGAYKIDAWMASAKASINPSDKFGLVLGYDFLSGDDYIPEIYGGEFGMPRHEVSKGFSPVYGSRSKFYGIMDYFYESAYIHGFSPGLQNAFAGITYSPVNGLSLGASYHYLAVSTKLKDLGMTLGHDIDIQASYAFSKDISLTTGLSYMSGTETMQRLKQDNSNNNALWGWFSLVISPCLFSTGW
ncbi:MAG: hypothetical protein IKO77_03080 [Bacteroidales bacterium]|nr:hypothetical protein [Bacteroidales bacterium]